MMMADKFTDWDRFMRHYTLTQNPQTALRWTAYEKWAEKRAFARLALRARLQAIGSHARSCGVACKPST